MSTFLSTLFGGVVTWVAAWWYYAKAGKELRNEASELRKLINVVLGSLEHAGLAKLTRDASGNVTGFIVELSGTGRATPPIAWGQLTVTPRPDQPPVEPK